MKEKIGVLLVNLGTPDSPKPKDVFRYLNEFLTDGRVIDNSWLMRQMLVRGLIVPLRFRNSARSYSAIWTKEGSPLMVYGRKVQLGLQHALGDSFIVELAMRYQNPPIKQRLDHLRQAQVEKLIILPLFPQYASATTGSVHQKVMEIVSKWDVVPQITFINSFATHPKMIDAFCAQVSQHRLDDYDHLVFSFHGLPQKHLTKIDKHQRCFKTQGCCEKVCDENKNCYSAQCYATAHAIVKQLNITPEKYTVCFQSRLGSDPWLQPYTTKMLQELCSQGKKRILVMCPAFVCDCLETIYEVREEYAQEFKHLGGEKLDLVDGLNDHPIWIEALQAIVEKHAG